MQKRARFRKLLKGDRIIVAPGVYDALGARVVERVGFDTVYLTGSGTSASLLGSPDIGLLTLNEMVTQARNIDTAVRLPVIADCESGFGNAVNVMRAVREYEKAGVVAIHIEDQVVPKKYKPGHGVQVTPMEEHGEKVRAAIETRRDADLVIIARTDARDRHGIKEAIRRANAYVEAGADMIFVHGPQTVDELEAIAKEVKAPQVINYSTMIESGARPLLSVTQLEDMGFKLLIFPSILLVSCVQAMKCELLSFRKEGKPSESQQDAATIDEVKTMVDWEAFREAETNYLPEEG